MRIRIRWVEGTVRAREAGGNEIVFMCRDDRGEDVKIQVPLSCAPESIVKPIRKMMNQEISEALNRVERLEQAAVTKEL